MRQSHSIHIYTIAGMKMRVRSLATCDGLIRVKHAVEVRQKGAAPVSLEVETFYAFQAANEAAKMIQEGRI